MYLHEERQSEIKQFYLSVILLAKKKITMTS